MEIRILGPLEVSDDGRVVELGAGRQRALLALLALHAREIVATDHLIEELWGGSPPPTAAKALQNLVSQLRRSLGADSIATRPPGYSLRLDADDLDARRFERLAAEGRRLLEEDPGRAGQTLLEALGLWRGRALADFAYEDFAQSEITRLDELRLGAIEDRIDADLAWVERLSSFPSSSRSCRLIRCASGCEASSCSRCTGAAARQTLSRPTAGPAVAGQGARAQAGR